MENSQLNMQTQWIPMNRWPVEKILEWFNRKFPAYFELYKESLIQNQITGEVLLEFNIECLNQLNIYDTNLR